jgi:hypothetical protein
MANIYRGATVRPVFYYENTSGGYRADLQLDLISLDGNTYSFESDATGWQTTTSSTDISNYDTASWSSVGSGSTGGRWYRDLGGTPSTGTGRSDAASGSYYLYAETSSPATTVGFDFLLRGPQVTLGDDPDFTWYEARYSSDSTMGTLKVYLDVITSGGGGAPTGLSPLLATTTGSVNAWVQEEAHLGFAEGFRITEASDTRITEAGDSRISEQFAEGLSALSGTGSLSVSAVASVSAASSLSSIGSKLTAAGLTSEADPITLSATGTMTATGGALFQDSVSLPGTGTATFLGLNSFDISKSLSGVGTANFDGIRIKNAATSLSGSGTFTNDGFNFVHFGAAIFEDEEFIRITEAGDTRIDEAGNTRIVIEGGNIGIGYLEADCTQIVFSSIAYVKWNGEWTTFTPKVKQDGTWDDPLAIYKKIDANTWKRAY